MDSSVVGGAVGYYWLYLKQMTVYPAPGPGILFRSTASPGDVAAGRAVGDTGDFVRHNQSDPNDPEATSSCSCLRGAGSLVYGERVDDTVLLAVS